MHKRYDPSQEKDIIMRKPKTTQNTVPVSTPLSPKALDAVRGGINGGLNRDIIRRTVPKYTE